MHDKVTLVIDYRDIQNALIYQSDSVAGIQNEYKYSIYERLSKQVDNFANTARDCVRLAIINILDEVDKEYLSLYEGLIKAEFSGILNHIEIPQINSEMMNKYIQFDGVVIYRDDASKLQHHNRVYTCSLGHLTRTSVNRISVPQKCAGYDPISKTYERCEEQWLEEKDELADKDDLFEILIQERTDRVADFRSAGMVWVKVLGRDNVNFAKDKIRNGDFVSMCGIVKAEESQEKNRDKSIKIFEYYVQSSSIMIRPISELVQDNAEIKELVKVFVQRESEDEDYKKLVESVAPDIYRRENDLVAEAVLLTCVGSDERINPLSGSRTRGEPQIFLCGDPSSGKTTYGKWAVKVVPRSFYNSGDKTSAVSLIGGVKPSHREGKTGKLEIGSYGLGQLVVVDELEKMKYEDLQRLAEPLQDDQSITLAKQGYYKNRDISVATIAFANPVKEHARWDVTLDIYQNTKLPSWLLERFDAIFIVRDIQDDFTDLAKINFKAKNMLTHMKTSEFHKIEDKQQAMMFNRTSGDDRYSIGEMKHWIQYVRDNFHPNIWKCSGALKKISDFYMQFRKYSIRTPKNQEEKDTWTRDKEIPAIELRGFMALCRFAEARARACHRNYCTEEDAEHAMEIIRTSKMSAGVNTNSLLGGGKIDRDPELRELKLKAMQQIKSEMLDRQHTTEGRTFTNVLEKISWDNCTNCKGSSVIYDSDVSMVCPECLGNGGFRKPFTQNDFFERCNNAKVPIGIKMFREMFKRASEAGEIVLDKYGPVKSYHNTKSRIEYRMGQANIEDTTGKYDFLRDEAKKDTIDAIHKRRIAERHPELLRRLEKVDDADIGATPTKDVDTADNL